MSVGKICIALALTLGTFAAASPALSQNSGLVLPRSSIGPGTAPYLPPGLRPQTLPRFKQPTIAEDAARRRAVRRQLDASDIRPEIRSPSSIPNDASRARAGRSDLDRNRAGDFARSGPTAIGASPVTRPSLGARRIR